MSGISRSVRLGLLSGPFYQISTRRNRLGTTGQGLVGLSDERLNSRRRTLNWWATAYHNRRWRGINAAADDVLRRLKQYECLCYADVESAGSLSGF